MRILILIIIATALLTVPAFSKDFIHEHTYYAGDDDSKNDCREKALQQIQLATLAEAGIYIQSEWELKETDKTAIVKEEIKTITAGLTKTTVISEDWDGFKCHIKAKVKINVRDALKQLRNTVKTHQDARTGEIIPEVVQPKPKPYKERWWHTIFEDNRPWQVKYKNML